MPALDRIVKNRDEEQYRKCELRLDAIAQEQRRAMETSGTQLATAIDLAFGRIDYTTWKDKSDLLPLKFRSLTQGAGLQSLCTKILPAIYYPVHGDREVQKVWLASTGQLCVKLKVRFLTGKREVLVPINDRHVRISPTTAANIMHTLKSATF